jgi:transaldolase
MKIFIDTANPEQIREAYIWGIIDGVTTNPTIFEKAIASGNGYGEQVKALAA